MWLSYFKMGILLLCVMSFKVAANDTATKLYAEKSPMVFQVRVIDKGSGNKSIIGSGFQVSAAGVIATNYHVVSEYLLDPTKYTIEILSERNQTTKATVINFDIVHDLALLQAEKFDLRSLSLSDEPLEQGNRLYSMGNPNDLGMTIVEGTYNGLVEASRYSKYLFSGSLNPGMSGGPVFNSAGEVIGVNVSKGGEQISFLVPAKYLIALIKKGFQPLNVSNYSEHTLSLLMKDQDDYYTKLIETDWPTKAFHKFELPDQIHRSMKCWGHTEESDDVRYEDIHRHCKSKDEIYINSDFYTGAFTFSYKNISSDELNVVQFYKLLEQNNEIKAFPNSSKKEDTTNFVCSTDFIHLNKNADKTNAKWKVSTCIREYVKYKGLYDAGLIAITVDNSSDKHDALIITIKNTGINKSNIKNLYKKFLDTVKWNQ